MKPWEMNWNAELQTSAKKPWEKEWKPSTTINAQDYNGSIFMGEDGEDVKPFEKFNKFFNGLIEVREKEQKPFFETVSELPKNIMQTEIKESDKELTPFQKAVEQTAKEGFSNVKWGEVGKAFGRGTLEFAKSMTSGNLRIIGDWYKDESDTSNMTPLEKHNVGYNNFISKSYTYMADLIDKVIDLGLEADWLKPDEEIFRGEFEENPSMTRAISTLGSGIPSIVAGAGVYKATKSVVLTTALLSEVDAQDIYFGAREAGISKAGATALLGIGTAGTYVGEKIGLDAIFGKKTRPFVGRIIESILSEGLTEGAQTWWQNAVKKYGYDDTQKFMQGVLESAIGGALTGGVATTFLGNVYEARDSMKEKGATDAELDTLQEAMATEIAKHRDTIEPMFETNIQKSLDSLNAVIDSNIDQAEVEKAKKISSDLKNIEDKYYDMLKGKMPEEQAKSTSEILRNMAYFGSKMTGMTPAEFEANEFPKIEWAKTFKDILPKVKKIGTRKIDESKLSLARFLQLRGGVKDTGGELKSFDARKTYPMLINNKNGMGLDDATLLAWEYGYLPEFTERPEINDLLDALGEEIGGRRKRYQPEYQKVVNLREEQERAEASVEQLNDYLSQYANVSDEQLKSMSEDEKQALYTKTREKQDFDMLTEDEQERYSMMRENGATHIEAMNNIKGAEEELLDDIPFQDEEDRNLVVTHATTLDKLEEALNLGAMPMPSLSVTKAEYAANTNFGEIIFVGGKNIINPEDKRNKTFSADIYSTRKIRPEYEITKDGVDYIKRQTGNISEKGEHYWVANISSDLERGSDFHLREIYLASKGKINNLDAGTYSIVNSMTDKEKADFSEWKRKFINDYTDKKIFEGFTPSGKRKYSPYNLDNILRIMKSKNLKGSEGNLNAHALRGIWAKEFKTIDEIRKAKGKLVDEAAYAKMDNIIWEETTKLSDLLVSEEKARELEQSFISPDDYMIEEVLVAIKPNSNIASLLKKADLRSDTKAVEAIKKYIDKVNSLPVKYFESKPQRAVDFSEFTGVIMPLDSAYDAAEKSLRNYGLDVIRTGDYKEAIDAFEDIFFQTEQTPLGAFYNDTVYLFEKADASTIPHEMSHYWKKELRSFDNPQAKALLEAADKWETAEFERLYKVIKRENGYAVANKDGSIVYDKRGQGFATEQDAADYAKDELFARGMERFLAEGKAPNKSMKQVFHNFLMWLHKKLKDAVSLKLNLSPDIKQVYSEILGGQDIDAFLNTDIDSFIQNRGKLSQEKEKYIDDEISKAVAIKSEKVKDKSGKGFSDLWANSMIPLSTRLERVSRKLRNKQRRYESDLALSLNKKYAQAKPFLNIWKNMEEEDIIAFDLALKNDYIKKQLEIVDKYNAREEWEQVRKLLEDTFDEAINAGIELGYRPDYFPRKVKDTQGFLDYLRGSENWTRFEEAIREADPDNQFTIEEQAEFLNKYLRGFTKVDLMPNKYGSEKTRSIEVIDNEINRFYASSMEALVSYIEGLNSRIQASKFLGRDAENLEESIGGYLTYLLNNNIIGPKQVDEVRDILQARFGAKGVSNKFLRTGRDLSYIYTMGGINSAITQIDDLSVSIYKAGIWNTITAAFEAKKITREDLGLENISAEFVDGSKTAQAVNKVFKMTGLDGIDAFAKNTLLNAMMKKYQKMYKTDKTQLKALLEPVMEDETIQTMEDINNGELSDNVRYLLFSELSDVQPVSLSELPAYYNRGGNLRVLYMLKSFAIKRIDIYRNECFDKIRSKNWETQKEGVQNLFRLAATMMVLGSAKDKIIDLLYGRQVDLTETMINNLLGLVGISKFQVYQARDKGLTSTVKDLIFPPLYSVIDDMIGDIWNVSQGKRELKDMETLKGIPLVGRFYYWWVGRGREKSKGKKKKY